MSEEFTVVGRVWLGGDLVVHEDVPDDPFTMFQFGASSWAATRGRGPWKIELRADDEIEMWTSDDEPTSHRAAHVGNVVHHFIRLRNRWIEGGEEEED